MSITEDNKLQESLQDNDDIQRSLHEKFMTEYYVKKIKTMNLSNDTKYGECEDCFCITLLRGEDACMCGYNCTTKWICRDFCLAVCTNGHKTKYVNPIGFIETVNCEVCNVEFQPMFIWWGLSPDAYINKYGD